MEELKKLYDTLVREGYYTNSYEEFVQKYNGSDAYKDQVFGVVSRDGLYTKSKEEFLLKYKSPELKTKSFVEDEVEVKKKDASDSDSEVGLLERFKAKYNIQEDDVDLREQPPVQAIDQTRVARPKFIDPVQAARAREAQEAYDAQRKLDMEAFKTQEKLDQEAQLEQQKINQTLLLQSEQFQNDLSIVTADLIDQEEEAVVPVLNKKFQKYGFSFEKTGIGDALVVTNFDGSATETIDLDPFTTDTEILESQKLKNFLSQHALEEFETNEALDFEGKSLKAQQLRRVGLINPDGTASTVLMTSYEEDGKHYAIPTLFPKNPEFYGTNPNDWMKLDFEEAKKVAEERGEVFQFDTEEEAQRFAEGEWKDTHSTDALGKQLYSETGLNFKAEQARYDKYLEVRDKIDFIESQVADFGTDYIEELTPEQKKLYGGLYVDGILRDDTDEVLAELKKIEDDLYSEVNTSEKIDLREKYDLALQKKYSALAKDASIANYQAKAFEEALEVEALETFGVGLKDLTDVKPETEREAALLDSFKVQVASLNAEKQHAANIYESAKTFYSAKYDKSIMGEFETGMSAVMNELQKGLNDGNAAEVILQLSTGLPFDFQSLDLDNPEDRKKAAEMIVALKTKNRGKKDSRALSRWNRAKGFRESLDAFLRNPHELALSLAANSIGMMLPYGFEIVVGSTAAGAGTGAVVGSVVPGAGTAVGAIKGGQEGLKAGMALTSLAMEYTNEYFAAMESEGYDVLNAKDVELAMQDADVWALAKERGLKRGIPIALVDYLTSGLAGRVFKVGKTATRTKKIASQLAERAIFDPVGEMAGEAAAQVVVGDQLDWKEIAAEGIGGFGNNASMMAVNKLIDARNMSNIELASKLTDINFIVNEKESDTRISAWTNNMLALGKINEDQGQRIQKNLGLSKDADNMLDFGRSKNRPKNKRVKARLMELLAAKEEYTADTNRKEVFSQKIKDINTEIAYLIENKSLAPDNKRAKIEAIFSPGVEVGDVRTGLSQYVIDGKSYTKQEFLKKLGKMSVRELTKFNGKVVNDEEVANQLNDKINAVQKPETESVDARQQAAIGTGVGTEVSLEETTELETTETQEVVPTTKPETIVAVAPFFDTTIESAEQAQTLRENEGYQQYKNNLTGIGQQLGLEVEVEEGIGGYKNDAGTEIVEISNRVVLKNATIEQAEEYAALAAALAPETQESSIAAAYVEEGAENHNGNEYTLNVTDTQGTIDALKKAGITDFSINEDTGEVSFINIFDFDDPTLQDKIGIFVQELEANNITYEKQNYRAVNSVYVDQGKRKEILRRAASKRSADRQTGSSLYNSLLQAVENDAKFQGITTEEYLPGIKEIQASATAAAQEVTDLKTTLDDTKVDFRKKEDDSFTPIKGEVDAVTKAINETQSGNVSTNLVVEPEGTIDVNELNSRTDRKLPSIKTLEVINGIPAIFNISDQLTTGNAVNIFTGNTIDNLKGGLGFTGTIGNENAAWASTTKEEAQRLLDKAKKVYNDNKELFDKFWKDNPEFNGHVPMNIVKMGEGSIASNEAVFRVLKDNLSKVPAENKVKALEVLRQDLQDIANRRAESIKKGQGTDTTLKKYQEEITNIENVIEAMKDMSSIEQILNAEFLSQLNIPTRELLGRRITTGSVRRAGAPKKKVTMPAKSGKPVVLALLEGMEASTETASLTHIQEITDLITEPQLANVPQRSIIALQAVDVTVDDVIETNHPNYPFGPKGKTIGILEQPVSLVETYPEAYRLAMAGLTSAETKQERVTKTKAEKSKGQLVEGELAPASVGTILTQKLGVQYGLPGLEFEGALAQTNMDNVAKLNAFMNIAFPSVTISTDTSTFNNVMESEGVKKYLKGDEVIYGVTVDGDIYVNPDVHNSQSALFNTSIHEMGHVWTDYLQTTKKGKAIYAQGVKLVEQTEEYKKQLKNFNGDKVKAANETMAILIGNKGQTIADGAVKSKFTQWLLGMWNYIKSQFKMSKDLTAEEIQDMNLDTFLGTALADIFAGKEINLTKTQEKKLKNPDAAFSKTDSMGAIINKGRQNGFSDASIKEVLKDRGFKVADINAAMEVKVDAFTPLPEAFGRVEGGVSQGMQLFNEVRQKLSKFTTPEKTLSEVRQKAMDLIKENPIYKAQPEQTQMEILVDFDKTLNTRSNVAVQKEIAAIKNNLRQRKINSQNLKAAQIQLRNYIRKALPKSKMYTQAQINKLISRVTKSTVDTFQADTEYVMKIVDQQKAKMKNALVKDMLKLVKAKAMTAFTKSGKRRAKGLSREGTAYFKAVKQILTADIDDLNKIQQDLQNESTEINNLIEKQNDGQKLTQKEQAKVNLALAMDTFGDVSNMSLEEVQDLMQQLKDVRAESIATFKSRRQARVEANKKMKEEADAQIKDTNPMLFDADGNVLNKNERNARKNEILSHFRNFEIGKAFSELGERMKFSTAKEFIQSMKQMFQHLGTLTNVLDRVTQGKNFFTKNVYDSLNRMDDLNNGGVFQTQGKLDAIANTIPGITKGAKQIYSKLNSGVHVLKLKRSDTGREYTDRFNADELMRIYALSLNDVQRQKLEAQGITPEVIKNIKSIIGPEAVEFADKTVNFLSNEYYESVNDVYSYVNDVNLGYVNNYFPTSTIQKETTKKMITDGDFSGVFNAESAPAFKERVDMRSDVDLHSGGFTNVLKNHVDTMEKYKAYAVGTQRLNALFKIDSVNVLLEEMGVAGPIKNAVNFAINPESGKDASLNPSLISRLQTKFTGFALAFKAIQILKQATSFVNAYSDYSYFPADSRVPRVVQAAVDLPMFMFDGARVVLSLAKDLVGKKGAVREAMEISPTFRKRVEQGLEGDVVGLESGRQTFKKTALTGGKLKRAQAAFKTAAASPTIIGDVLGVMGYMINYKRNIANGMSKADAVKAFNDYNATQQSRRGTDKIPIQRNNNVFVRGFTMFGSTLFLQMNKVMQSTTNITRDMANKKRPRSKDTRDLALNLAVANVLFATAANIAKFIKGDDEDRETAMKSIAEAMMGLNLIYQIPYLGSTVKDLDIAGQVIAGVKGEEYKRGRIYKSDVVNPFASVLQKYKKLTKEDENKVGAVVRTLTEITIGAQIDPFVGLYNYFAGEEEDVDPAMYDILGISPSYRPENKGSASKGMSKKDMKKFAPGLYEELYGPGGSLAPVEQLKKDERKRKRDLQKEIDAAMGLD